MRKSKAQKRAEEARELLETASFQALQLLAASIGDTTLKPELRVKCAENILERACRQAAAGGGEQSLRVSFENGTRDCAE